MMPLLRLWELWELLFNKQDDSFTFMMPDVHMKLNTCCPLTPAITLKWFCVVSVWGSEMSTGVFIYCLLYYNVCGEMLEVVVRNRHRFNVNRFFFRDVAHPTSTGSQHEWYLRLDHTHWSFFHFHLLCFSVPLCDISQIHLKKSFGNSGAALRPRGDSRGWEGNGATMSSLSCGKNKQTKKRWSPFTWDTKPTVVEKGSVANTMSGFLT